MIRYGSVCSGIEAASVAWAPLGWRAQFVSEIEAFPRAVLKYRHPGVPMHGDFTTIQADDYDPIDALVGGTPCQSFSVAGLRGGMADDRGNLALEYLRLADRLRPRWLVWENVPGVLSSNGGRDFGSFLGGLGQLGYGFAYRVLDAQYFGLAQRRKRVFVVGHLGDWRRAAAVLFEPESLRGHPAPSRKAGARVAPTVARGSPGGRTYGLDADTAESLVAFGGNNTSGSIDVATTLTAHGGPMGRMDFESETFVASCAPALSASNPYGDHESREGLLIAHTLCGEGFDASEDGTGRGTPLVPVSIALRGRDGGAAIEMGDDVAYTLRASQGGGDKPHALIPFDTTQITSAQNRSSPQVGDPCHPLAAASHPPAVAFQQSQSGLRTGETHATLDANNGSRRHNGVLHGSAVRRLTPRECERLQGFPDDYTLIPWRNGYSPDGPRYKALGNSMAVPVMRWIGERIEMVEAQQALERAA